MSLAREAADGPTRRAAGPRTATGRRLNSAPQPAAAPRSLVSAKDAIYRCHQPSAGYGNPRFSRSVAP